MKFSFRSLVKSNLDSQSGIGVELFRLSDADPEELTSEELDAAIEAGGDSSPAEIAIMRLYDEPVEDSCARVEEFAEALDSFSDVERLHLHINSRGGEVFAAHGICYMLGAFTPRKIAYIGDVAAGTATIIMCSCDEIIASHNSSLIFCEPQDVAYGDAEVIRNTPAIARRSPFRSWRSTWRKPAVRFPRKRSANSWQT